MHINDRGLGLIKRFEGLKLEAYLCPAGVPTIGYGHTGPEVKLGMVVSEVGAEALLKVDLGKFERGVSSAVKVLITEDQFSALVSFSYNVGLGNFESSSLLRFLNNKQFGKAADEFPKWNKARGMILPGLVRRRAAEQELFLS